MAVIQALHRHTFEGKVVHAGTLVEVSDSMADTMVKSPTSLGLPPRVYRHYVEAAPLVKVSQAEGDLIAPTTVDTAQLDALQVERDEAVAYAARMDADREAAVMTLEALQAERGALVKEIQAAKTEIEQAWAETETAKAEAAAAKAEVEALKAELAKVPAPAETPKEVTPAPAAATPDETATPKKSK